MNEMNRVSAWVLSTLLATSPGCRYYYVVPDEVVTKAQQADPKTAAMMALRPAKNKCTDNLAGSTITHLRLNEVSFSSWPVLGAQCVHNDDSLLRGGLVLLGMAATFAPLAASSPYLPCSGDQCASVRSSGAALGLLSAVLGGLGVWFTIKGARTIKARSWLVGPNETGLTYFDLPHPMGPPAPSSTNDTTPPASASPAGP